MKIKKDEKLSEYTTIGIGGAVPELYLPETEAELVTLVQELTAQKKHYRIIGNGSNVLADDRGLQDPVICTRNMERSLTVEDENLTVDAGYPMAQLAYQSAAKGLTGLEFAVGIPGSIGGVVRMNAGAHGRNISEVVHSVRMILAGGHAVEAFSEELQFTYRSSAIPPDAIITTVTLQLRKADSAKVHELIRKNNEHRITTQPLKEKSAGCIFRNPDNRSAGQMIEDSGLKGFNVGGATVSELHANFIVNRNQASFDDVLQLIDHIKRVVWQKHGIQLQEEVVVWRNE